MSHTEKDNQLISAIADLRGEEALALVRERLAAKDDPLLLIAKCQEGMRQIGERYEQQEYFLAGLIMGGEIFRELMGLFQPALESQISGNASGRVLLGTVAGDIHDLGKNIVSVLLRCHKFTVYDLGVDVPPSEFTRKAREIQPDIVGLSGLITLSYDSMRDTINLLHAEGCQAPIIIGGSLLDEEIRKYTGADYWVTDAIAGIELCQQLLTGSKKV